MRQLKYFVGVAEVSSFTKAAAILGIAQPALSRQIRDLESELGVALLLRNGRGAVLTDAGEFFLRSRKEEIEDMLPGFLSLSKMVLRSRATSSLKEDFVGESEAIRDDTKITVVIAGDVTVLKISTQRVHPVPDFG